MIHPEDVFLFSTLKQFFDSNTGSSIIDLLYLIKTVNNFISRNKNYVICFNNPFKAIEEIMQSKKFVSEILSDLFLHISSFQFLSEKYAQYIL